MNWKRTWTNAGVAAVSTAFALCLCELGARLVLRPVDYLSPRLERDEVLGMKLPGGSGGHDDWGFRNPRVPPTAEVVALGDSHTYGNGARLDDSWPSVVARLTGRTVYNLGMGGYGPNQYYHLLLTKALSLKPRTIVCGLYLGDDFDNAFRMTYGSRHWSSLRREDIGETDADIWEKEVPPQLAWHKTIRNWLSSHSILYRVVVHGLLQPVLGRLQLDAQIRRSAPVLLLPERHIEEAFLPDGVLRGLDQNSPRVAEGMRLTFQLLRDMNAQCARNQVRFVVAVIPTKEMVFARYLESSPAADHTIDRVLTNERIARQALFVQLQREGIDSIDLLPALEEASETERIYLYSSVDMHPNANGYRVIAESISRHLTTPAAGSP